MNPNLYGKSMLDEMEGSVCIKVKSRCNEYHEMNSSAICCLMDQTSEIYLASNLQRFTVRTFDLWPMTAFEAMVGPTADALKEMLGFSKYLKEFAGVKEAD
ncbi:hypothetical protein HAX54_036984 [Datura stramonium]|uniref:Uncharacterized protein n=1 Tax=Datura stramonium TaxID=4076 RepID=A0ABS8VKF0_DATST|nr:hypothetical protein [Datura stramonium]